MTFGTGAQMPILIHDLRQALRMLVKNPGFATAAVLTLGLGIGANTAIFSIIDGVLLQPLPYKNPDDLASIVTTLKQQNSRQSASLPVSFTKFTRVREHSHALQSVAAYHPIAATLSTHGVAEQIPGARASANFFDVLAVRVARGRTFLPEEDREGSSTAAIITDRLWRTHFGADRNILGVSVPIDGESATNRGGATRQFPNAVPTARARPVAFPPFLRCQPWFSGTLRGDLLDGVRPRETGRRLGQHPVRA
jgi:putative ABC transport system permease protein